MSLELLQKLKKNSTLKNVNILSDVDITKFSRKKVECVDCSNLDWESINRSIFEEEKDRFNKEWRENNKEKHREICANGGKIGGKWHAGTLWWTTGKENKKSRGCPGEGWVRGMTKGLKNVT